MNRNNIMSVEALIHTIIHFLGVCMIFWFIAAPPLWITFLFILIWVAQIKILGNCFLTRIAHYRKIMLGMSYFEYIAHVLGVKDHKKGGYFIDLAIKIVLGAVLIVRFSRIFMGV